MEPTAMTQQARDNPNPRFAKLWTILGLIEKDDSVRRLIISAFTRQSVLNSTLTIVAATAVVLALASHVPLLHLLVWWGLTAGMALFLLSSHYRYVRRRAQQVSPIEHKRRPGAVDSTIVKACLIAALSGAFWGAGVFFLPQIPLVNYPFVVIVAGAMAAGAATTLAPIPLAAHLYVMCAILPYAAYFMIAFGDTESTFLGALAIVMTFGMVWATRLVHGSVLKEFGLRDRNAKLVQFFQSEREEWLDAAFSAYAYAIFDPEGQLQVWNDGFAGFLDLSAHRLEPGMTLELVSRLQVPMRSGGPGKNSGADQTNLEALVRDGSGEWSPRRHLSDGRWIRTSARKTRGGSSVLVFSDETELVAREIALAEGERRFEAYAKIGQDELIAVSGPELRVTQWICSEESDLEPSWRHSPIGQSLPNVIPHWEDDASSSITLVERLKAGIGFRNHIVSINSGASRCWKSVSGVPVGDSADRKSVFLLTVTDITRSREEQYKSELQNLRFTALAEVASEVVFDINPEGHVTAMYGAEQVKPDPKLLGMHFDAIWNSVKVEIDADSSLAELVERREFVYGFEYRARMKDGGTWRYLRANGLPLYDTDGDYMGYCLAVRNINETKVLEKENQLRAKEISDLTENLSAGLFRMSKQDDGELVVDYANAWLASEYGVKRYALDALLSGNPTPLISSSDAAERRETIAAFAATNDSYQHRWQLRLPDGRKRWILERGRFLKDEGGAERIEGFLWDVTQAVEYEEALKQGQKRLSDALAVLDSAKDAIAIQDDSGRLVYSNAAARDLMCPDAMQSSEQADYVSKLDLPESDRNELTREIEVSLPVFKHWEKAIPFASEKHGVRTLEMRLNATPEGGVVFVGTDITAKQRFKTEEQRLRNELADAKQMQEVGQLAGGIAHDFANIIASVQTFSDLLIDDAPGGSQELEYAEKISKACSRATDMVEQIVLLAKTSKLETEAVPLIDIFEEASALLENSFDEFAQLTMNLEATDLVVESSRSGVLQILLNLSLNAQQALRDGEGLVAVNVERVSLSDSELVSYGEGRHQLDTPTDGEPPMYRVVDGSLRSGVSYACVSVEDDGVGIVLADIGRIFEPFYTTKGHGKGTGLGLAIVRNVLSRSFGAFVVESREGEGACFKAFLPLSSRSPSADTAPKVAGQAHQTKCIDHPGRVLVVDDETDLSDILSTALSKVGYEATGTYSGDEAWQIFNDDPTAWDLIITDQVMPGLRGTELIEKVRGTGSEIPIILCTAYSETLTKTSALELGADLFLSKPVLIKELIANVDTFLK